MLEGPDPTQPERTSVIACAAVIEELLPYMPPGMRYRLLDSGLHANPEALKRALQEAIDASAASSAIILLGFGLCSQAVVGLRGNGCTLVVPKVDDCIAICLGSQAEYRAQSSAEPGTYYLTRGWIEAGENPFEEYDGLVGRYGEGRAQWLMGLVFKHYTRLALINTGQVELGECSEYCRRTAKRFGLRYEEIPGCNKLIKKMLHGPWDDDFVVARPGQTISFLDFKGTKQQA